MIISYVFPFELTQTQMFADTEKDFEKIVVNTSGVSIRRNAPFTL